MLGSPDDLSGRASASSAAAVGPLVVVEAKVALQRAIELSELREVAATELDPPVLVEDRVLQTLHEAVGEGVTRLRAGVPDPELRAGLVEGLSVLKTHPVARRAGRRDS
jgi:hypothetical protein